MSTARSVKTSEAPVMSKGKAWFEKYKQSLRYSFYVMTHPFDGFWDLSHEKKGSLAAAHTFLFLFLLVYILKLLLTSFQFVTVSVQHLNVFEQVGSLLLPFLILCLANWAMTTLFDGKGRFKDIYMAMCYALVPYIIIQAVMILVSNVITFEEGSFYTVILSVSIVWSLFLAFVGLMEVHDYGPGKTLLFVFVTIFGACVIIFLILVFLSLLGDAVGFFVSLYREIVYRLY